MGSVTDRTDQAQFRNWHRICLYVSMNNKARRCRSLRDRCTNGGQRRTIYPTSGASSQRLQLVISTKR